MTMDGFRNIALLSILFFSIQVIGQENDSINNIDYSLMSLQDLMNVEIKLGTRGEVRKIFDSSVPIDIITSEDIERSGFISTGAAIQSLIPSFNYVRSTITDGSDHIRVATLRGLGPDQLLVLVNGKRRHNTALMHVNSTPGRGSTGVDFDAIPISIIKRIEVLRDGAAAQYGSDAIAGIINIVLKDSEELTVATHYGVTSNNDGEKSMVLANFGVPIFDEGNINVSLEYKRKDNINRAGPDNRQQYFEGDPRNNDPELNNQVNHIIGEASFNELSFFLNANIPIDSYNLYVFGGINRRRSESAGFYRRALDDRNIRAIYPDGFLPLITPVNNDESITVGMEGNYNGWDWDLSVGYGNNNFELDIENSLNTSMGLTSPKDFYAGTLKYSQSNINFDISNNFNIGLEEDLNIAFGIEFRNEKYSILSGEEASYINGEIPILDGPNTGGVAPVGSQVFPGFSPENATNKSREAASIYLEFQQQISESLKFNLAGRYENNFTFGETINGKFSFRYQPKESFAIRSSVSSGYRAPSLAQSFFTSTATIFESGDPYRVGTFSTDHPLALGLGAKELTPEKSTHLSAGFVFKPTSNLFVSVDGFLIDIKDRIVLSGEFTNDESIFGETISQLLESHQVSAGRYFLNAINTRSYGVDVVVNYNYKLNKGYLDCYAGYHFNANRQKGEVKTPDILDDYADTIFTREEQNRIEGSQPGDNLILKFLYSINKFEIAPKIIKYGEFKIKHFSDPNRDETHSARWIAYLNLAYKPTKQTKISVGANNLFNVMPSRKKEINNLGGLLPYNHFSQYGVGGSYYYFNLKLSI